MIDFRNGSLGTGVAYISNQQLNDKAGIEVNTNQKVDSVVHSILEGALVVSSASLVDQD